MDIMIIKMNRERGGTVVAVNGRVANHVHFLYRIGSRKSPLLFCINISGSERSNRGARLRNAVCARMRVTSVPPTNVTNSESQHFTI